VNLVSRVSEFGRRRVVALFMGPVAVVLAVASPIAFASQASAASLALTQMKSAMYRPSACCLRNLKPFSFRLSSLARWVNRALRRVGTHALWLPHLWERGLQAYETFFHAPARKAAMRMGPTDCSPTLPPERGRGI
jgi:hypothetical protein